MRVETERNFAYRTGDSITFTVFVAQAPGTLLDAESFAVTDTNAGDIEFTSKLLGTKALKDGGKVFAVQVTLRKWSYEPSFNVAATMSYIVSSTGDTDALSVPDISLHMSATWDGRKTLQEGDEHFARDSDAIYDVILIGVGFGISILAVAYIRRARRKNSMERALAPRVPSKLELARERFELTRDLIEGRDFRLSHYEELERVVRSLFNVEALPTAQVGSALGSERSWARDDVITILTECDKRLYQGRELSTVEHASLFDAFAHLLDDIPQHEVTTPQASKFAPVLAVVQHIPHRRLARMLRPARIAPRCIWRHRPFRYYR